MSATFRYDEYRDSQLLKRIIFFKQERKFQDHNDDSERRLRIHFIYGSRFSILERLHRQGRNLN